MLKYVKHMKSLANKSRPRKAKKPSEVKFSDARLRSSPGDLGATPSGSADASSVACVTEARVEELISCQISKLSSSFAPSMDASFVNIKHMIDSRLSSSVSQDVSNHSFSAPSRVPVFLSPSQGQQHPSLTSPRIGYGNPGG